MLKAESIYRNVASIKIPINCAVQSRQETFLEYICSRIDYAMVDYDRIYYARIDYAMIV